MCRHADFAASVPLGLRTEESHNTTRIDEILRRRSTLAQNDNIRL